MSESIISCETTSFAICDIKTLILLLKSPENGICVGAIEAITKYAELSHKNGEQLLSLKITKSLIDLTQSRDVAIRKSAVACLAAITEFNETHPEIRRKELIEVLISALAIDESSEVQDEAAFALANLAKDFANKADIRKLGGIRALIRVLESPDPDVRKNAGLALSILLDDFANRSEIRYINGIGPILDLLIADFTEIQENALNSLVKCAEDHGNRIEIRKQNGLKKLVDLLSQENLALQPRILKCIEICLEDSESSNTFAETGGFPVLIKLAGLDDITTKKMIGNVLHKLSRIDRNTNYLRESGALTVLLTNLLHYDSGVISASAYALCNLAKNEINQIELHKMGIIDILVRLFLHEDLEVRIQSVSVLSSLFPNGKIRSKIRNSPDCLIGVIKLLQVDDEKSIISASECISILAEEGANRADFIKNGCINGLLVGLEKNNHTVQESVCLALARCLQDADGQIVISKASGNRGILRLIELLGSKDVSVCRKAAYSLSSACQLDINAITACSSNALEALISLAKDSTKNATNFAVDATDKILNYHLSAKFWLRNILNHENIMNDGFYDIGSAGPNLDAVHNFPTLSELNNIPPNKKREVILIEWNNDSGLQTIYQEATENLSTKSPQGQIRQIANAIAKYMGGKVKNSKVEEFSYKFHVSDLKVKLNSNVIPIGQISQGTFYHRALLFKAICDRVGLSPCTIVRGEYNRAWNIVDTRKQSLVLKTYAALKSSAKDNAKEIANSKDKKARPRLSQQATLNVKAPFSTPMESAQNSFIEEVEEEEDAIQDSAIVDLLFDPGNLLVVGTPMANAYQRM